MVLRTSLIIGIAILGTATAALAQPSATPEAPPPAIPAAPQPAPAPAPAPAAELVPAPVPAAEPVPVSQAAPPAPRKWAFGFRLVNGSFRDDLDNEGPISGYGVFVRYRFSQRWEAEVDLGKESAELGGDRVRELRPMSLSVLWHLKQLGRFDLSLRGGYGRAKEIYRSPSASVDYNNSYAYIGANLDFALRSTIMISVNAQGLHLARDDRGSTEGLKASGTQFGLAAAYRF